MPNRKLIEVALLEVTYKASVHEKSIRHGRPGICGRRGDHWQHG
jgi:hypothetical protein